MWVSVLSLSALCFTGALDHVCMARKVEVLEFDSVFGLLGSGSKVQSLGFI